MKKINIYIKESIEDNLFWKIDKYFENHDKEFDWFLNLIDYCRKNPGYNKNTIENYINTNNSANTINIKKFVDFVDDVIKNNATDRDYYYVLYNIIKQIISNKDQGVKYTKITEKLILNKNTVVINDLSLDDIQHTTNLKDAVQHILNLYDKTQKIVLKKEGELYWFDSPLLKRIRIYRSKSNKVKNLLKFIKYLSISLKDNPYIFGDGDEIIISQADDVVHVYGLARIVRTIKRELETYNI